MNTFLVQTDKKGMKSIDLAQWPDAAWDFISGGPEEQDYHRLLTEVDWLYRAIELVMISTADIPFYILNKRGDEVDTHEDWQNFVGFWPNPKKTIQLIAGGLFSYGYTYLLREKGGGIIDKDLRYMLPTSIKPIIDPDKGLTHFERRKPDGTIKEFEPAKEIVYFWLPDANVEIGPPTAWPAKAAFAAAAVIMGIDMFAAQFFERGAIKATILQVPVGTDKGETDKLKEWWRQFITGVKNAFTSNVLSTEVTATAIGEGLEALSDHNLTDKAREAIATASGIPQSLLMSNAANYATAEMDRKNLYENKLLPWSNMIEGVLNEQVFEELGYQFQFRPHEMTMFQEDEEQRSQSLLHLIGALNAAEDLDSFRFASEILGFDITDEQWVMITKHFAAKEERRQQFALQVDSGGNGNVDTNVTISEPEEDDTKAMRADLDKWQRKASKSLAKGNGADVEFVSDAIPVELAERLNIALKSVENDDDLKRVFDELEFESEPVEPLYLLAMELRRANNLLEASGD
jgi:phage portal protein BeeE